MNRRIRRRAIATDTWIPLRRVSHVPFSDAEIERRARESCAIMPGLTMEHARETIRLAVDEVKETWRNHLYQVHVIPWTPMKINGRAMPLVQLSIRRLDRAPARDWRDFQAIKNQLLGDGVEAVELYPAEDRLMDTANQYHLWCVADPLFRFPFGYTAGRVVTDASIGGSVNRSVPAERQSMPAFNPGPLDVGDGTA